MTEPVVRAENVEEYIKEALRDYLNEGPDITAELLELGEKYKLGWVPSAVATARRQKAIIDEGEKQAENFFKNSSIQPSVEPKPAAPAQPKPKEPEPQEEEKRKAAINRSPWAAAKAEPPKAVAETDVDEVARLEAELAEKKALVEVNQRPPHLVTPGMAAQKPAVALKEINKQHAVITNLGGKCVVMEWVPSPIDLRWEEPSYQSTTSFRERYANRYVEIITDVSSKVQRLGAEPLAPWWLCQPGRRQLMEWAWFLTVRTSYLETD